MSRQPSQTRAVLQAVAPTAILLAVLGPPIAAWLLAPTWTLDVIASLTGGVTSTAEEEARARMEEARARAAADDERRQLALEPLLHGELVPRADRGDCPVGAPDLRDRTGPAHDDIRGVVAASSRWASGLRTLASSVAWNIEENDGDGLAVALAELEEGLTEPAPPRDYELFLGHYDPAQVVGAQVFVGGRGVGTLFVYDREAGAIVCAGTGEGESSGVVQTLRVGQVDLTAVDLQHDLEVRIALDAAQHLHPVGPPPPPPPVLDAGVPADAALE